MINFLDKRNEDDFNSDEDDFTGDEDDFNCDEDDFNSDEDYDPNIFSDSDQSMYRFQFITYN